MTFFIGKELGIQVRSTEIEIEASLDPARFAGTDRSVRAGYQAFNVTIKVDADATALNNWLSCATRSRRAARSATTSPTRRR